MLAPGEEIDGKYRVVRRIGEGAMGSVFEAEAIRLRRRVALKVMHADLARERSLVMRFEREAQAAASIGSAHIVNVFDLGDLASGERYMVMEYLEGESLQERLARMGRLPPRIIAHIAMQLLAGLAQVHRRGIIHRDLKPANVFLAQGETGDEIVKILDFGICKMTDKSKGDLSTGVGALLGTLAYMSPEQVEHGSRDLDPRADLYAVGVILYRSVTGKLPYGATTVVELLRQLREGRAPAIAELASDVDRGFSAIVHRALEWDRTARYPSAREMQRALYDWDKSVAAIGDVLSDFLTGDRPHDTIPPSEGRPSSIPPSTPSSVPPSGAAVGRIALERRPAPEVPRRRSTVRMEGAPRPPGDDESD
ncbi:MAG: serine/threonine protein kinase [Deltaproteobacteria bacterium]|nr:serine/threonine protein kinase [Deltaproteobacteria bacterium]